MDEVLKEIQNLSKSVQDMNKQIQSMDAKIQSMDAKIQSMDDKIESYHEENIEFRQRLFLIEKEHGRKIDALYDLCSLIMNRVDENVKTLEKFDKRISKSELHIWNHEDRIVSLEKESKIS